MEWWPVVYVFIVCCEREEMSGWLASEAEDEDDEDDMLRAAP